MTSEIIAQEIRKALEEKLVELRESSDRCERCPEGPCEYCELRGCLPLLERSDARACERPEA